MSGWMKGSNPLILIPQPTGYTIAGGTTPKTLTVTEDVTLDQDLQKSASDVNFGSLLVGAEGTADYALHIKKAAVNAWAKIETTGVNLNAGFIIVNDAQGWGIGVRGSDGDKFQISSNAGLGVPRLTIDTSGNAGFKTTNPDDDIEINNPDGGAIRWSHNAPSGSAVNYARAQVGPDGDLTFTTVDSDGAEGHIILLPDGNFIINSTTSPASMVSGFAMATGTAPTGDVADQFSMFSADIVAGNAAPHIRTEIGAIVKLYQQDHIADPVESIAANNAAIDAILVALENNGLLASV